MRIKKEGRRKSTPFFLCRSDLSQRVATYYVTTFIPNAFVRDEQIFPSFGRLGDHSRDHVRGPLFGFREALNLPELCFGNGDTTNGDTGCNDSCLYPRQTRGCNCQDDVAIITDKNYIVGCQINNCLIHKILLFCVFTTLSTCQ